MKKYWLIVSGCCGMVIASVMAIIGASIFVMPAPVSPAVDWLARICLFGWLPAGAIGIALLVLGLVRVANLRPR